LTLSGEFYKGEDRHATMKIKNKAEFLNKEYSNLLEAGFTVHRFSTVHWRVSNPDSDVQIDVWPSTKKMWHPAMYSSSKKYDYLVDALLDEFDKYLN
jgi:hypothetical protein